MQSRIYAFLFSENNAKNIKHATRDINKIYFTITTYTAILYRSTIIVIVM